MSQFVNIFAMSLFAAELEEPKICIPGKGLILYQLDLFNTLPHMPVWDSSNSATNKDMMSKILTKGDTIF